MRILMSFAVALLTLVLPACQTTSPQPGALSAINNTLDAFHTAASEADEDTYFALLADDAVFLGTDATERWTKPEFQEWAAQHFERDSAWTYESIERHVGLNEAQDTAWFDEVVRNEDYGDLRGSGALILTPGGWKITQYNLVFPVPNEISGEVVEMIKAELTGE